MEWIGFLALIAVGGYTLFSAVAMQLAPGMSKKVGKTMSRGGPGRGQGRKPLEPDERKRPLSVRLPPDVIDWLDERAEQLGQSRAEILEDAMRRRMRSKAP